MRFKKTLNLYATGVQDAITSGNIKLQRGQWLRCGSEGRRCRFVRVNPGSGTLWVTHWQGSPSATQAHFNLTIDVLRKRGEQ